MNTGRAIMAVLEKVLAVLVAVMVLLVFANVLTRYVFHVSIAWSEEIARFLFVFVVAIGSVVATARGEHLNVDFFARVRSPGLARIVRIVPLVFTALALGVLVIGGIQLARLGMRHPAPVTGIPLGYITLVVAASMAAMLGIVVVKALHLLQGDN